MIPDRYLAIDTETSGLPAKGSHGTKDWSGVQVLRIGAVAMCRGEEIEAIDLYVHPAEGIAISPEAARVNGLDLETCRRLGLPITQVIEAILGLQAKHYSWEIVGHNFLAFDGPALEQTAKRHPFASAMRIAHGHDTMLLQIAWALGLRPTLGDSLERFYGRCLAATGTVRCSLDWCARTYLATAQQDAAAQARSGLHDPVCDARISGQVFWSMCERGILAEVLRDEERILAGRGMA